jgi:hypothetical protein
VVLGWVIETSILVVTAIEFSPIAVDAGRAVCTGEESATRSTAARLPQAPVQARRWQ